MHCAAPAQRPRINEFVGDNFSCLGWDNSGRIATAQFRMTWMVEVNMVTS